MNHTHIIAFLLGAIAQAVFQILFTVWDTKRKLREIRRQVDAFDP